MSAKGTWSAPAESSWMNRRRGAANSSPGRSSPDGFHTSRASAASRKRLRSSSSRSERKTGSADPPFLFVPWRPHLSHRSVLVHLEAQLVPIELERAVLIAHIDADRPGLGDHARSPFARRGGFGTGYAIPTRDAPSSPAVPTRRT